VRPWYETAFGRDYLERYPHRDEAEAREDVDAIVKLLSPDPAAPLLDLGCGAGRHLIAFCRAGFEDLVGLDLSEELLEIARRRLDEAACQTIALHCLDMRRIPYESFFGTAVSIFTSFGYFEADREDGKVLEAVRSALRPGGRFLLDTMNRDWTIAHLVASEEAELPGGRATVTRAITDDGLRVEKLVRLADPGTGEDLIRRESVRMYSATELAEMFAEAGFVDVSVFGSLRGEPFDAGAERTVVVGTKEST